MMVNPPSPSKAPEISGLHRLARGLYLYRRPHSSTEKGAGWRFLVAPPAPLIFGRSVIPAQAGTSGKPGPIHPLAHSRPEMPASAGMTRIVVPAQAGTSGRVSAIFS
jgi:hypothetical protein